MRIDLARPVVAGVLGNASMAVGSLIGHLAFGVVVGGVQGLPAPRQAASAAA